MQTISARKNWETGATPTILDNIHQNQVNIAIYQRDTSALISEVNGLLERNIHFKASGKVDAILDEMASTIDPNTYHGITQDITMLLKRFKAVTKGENFRVLLVKTSGNMCRKFHTDINDLRMLCTYHGPGTLWLKEDNINQKALNARHGTLPIPMRASEIQQVQTGDVAILKGAIYPNVQSAVVHRSPTIEKTGIERLLLRIDTDTTQNLWI